MPEPYNPHYTISPKLNRIKKKIFIVANHVPMKKPECLRAIFIGFAPVCPMNFGISSSCTPAICFTTGVEEYSILCPVLRILMRV